MPTTPRGLLAIGLAGLVAVSAFLLIGARIYSGGAAPTPTPTAQPTPTPRPTPTAQPTPTPDPTPTPQPTPTPDPTPVGVVADWQLVFSDDFADLDTSVWETGWFSSDGYSPAVNENGAACYHPDQLTVNDGALVLRIDPTTNPDCRLKDDSPARYVAGLMNTRETFTFSYGYAEARIFLPSEDGRLLNWPAFWHTGFDWPRTGEIDIAEGLTGGVLCSVYHHLGDDGRPAQERACLETDSPGGWHIVGADWQPDRITYYYDGVELFSVTDGVVGDPHYLIVNYTARSDGSETAPAEMFVDYVRVWQRESS